MDKYHTCKSRCDMDIAKQWLYDKLKPNEEPISYT
jgi:hypothetical protein